MAMEDWDEVGLTCCSNAAVLTFYLRKDGLLLTEFEYKNPVLYDFKYCPFCGEKITIKSIKPIQENGVIQWH